MSRDGDALAQAYSRMASYKPAKQRATVNALAKLAKKSGLDDDTREVIWTARHAVRCGSPLSAMTAIEREMNR